MGKEDVKRALEAMVNDDVIASQMADGDYSGVDGLDLSDDEQVLVRDAASDIPEVAGFAYEGYMKFDGIKGQNAGFDVFQKVHPNAAKFQIACNYAAKF